MNELQYPQRGEGLKAQWGRDVVDAISFLRPAAGAGSLLSSAPGGATVRSLDGPRLRTGYVPPRPLEARWVDDVWTLSGPNLAHAGKLHFCLPPGSVTWDGEDVPFANATASVRTGHSGMNLCYFPNSQIPLSPANGGWQTVWLHVYIDNSGRRATLSTRYADEFGETLARIPVCKFAAIQDSGTGVVSHPIKQLTWGAQHFHPGDKARAFEVRAIPGGGGWKIFLPNRHHLVYWGRQYYTVDGNIQAIPGDWYELLDDAFTGSSTAAVQHVWLCLVDTGGGRRAVLSPVKLPQSVHQLCVAELSLDASGLVRQSIVGAVFICGCGNEESGYSWPSDWPSSGSSGSYSSSWPSSASGLSGAGVFTL